jgi:hypothetical protein
LIVIGVYPVRAQEELPCTPQGIISSFALAVAEDNVENWLSSYEESSCEDIIKSDVRALAADYQKLVTDSETQVFECPPEIGIVCDLFSAAAQEQVEGARSFVFVNPPGAELQDRFTANCAHSNKYGLQLSYNITDEQGNAGWGVQWEESPTGSFDASQFTMLTFWVNGTEGGEIFQVGLKDKSGTELKVETKLLGVVERGRWTKFTIPFDPYFSQVKTNEIANLNFGFNINHGEGTICIDSVAFQ